MNIYPPQPPPVRTFGVEEELLLVHSGTFEPMPVAEEAVEAAGAAAGLDSIGFDVTLEVQQEQIEIAGPPQTDLAGQLASIRTGRRLADEAAAKVGARVAAVGTCPPPLLPNLVPLPRYRRMQERFGLTLQEQLTCGYHVHVGISSAEEGVAALNRMRPWLPVLLALSGNSPFWNGRDSGYSSFRYQAWSRWPTAGPPPLSATVADYERHVAALLASEVPLDEGMVYFDARLSRHVPTLEVRITDVCMDAAHAAGIAALVRALVETAVRSWRAGGQPSDVSAAELRTWSWQASRAGVGGYLISPVTARPAPAGDVVAQLLELVRPVLAEWQEDAAVEAIMAGILREGTGSMRQREAFSRRCEFADVLAEAVQLTHAGAAAELLLPDAS
ncbi:Carboxylate-amine ligase YbdK [Arthrobacter saudimassiliensis]|uniref:Putative glutamate--cysteine ligase 2 n=1 Tax=Arthrobacter saudimassiliensis TaxID=1461584 RepID=A0A078MKB8_9MICC|nr:Carboxylate-amine ligase YbdK [Arthrobacter saudimassiliensis]